MESPLRPRRRYPIELKAEVVRQVQESSNSVIQTAQTFSVSTASIYRWLSETEGPSLRMRERTLQVFTDEINRLKTETAQLEDERNVLVRTVQVFARLAR